MRGGRRTNLPSRILSRLQLFDDDPSFLADAPTPVGLEARRRVRVGGDGHPDKLVAARVSGKLDMGDIHGAVQALFSVDSFAAPDPVSLAALQSLHPPCPPDRRCLPVPSFAPFSCSPAQLSAAIGSFRAGSAAGPDGLLPTHLQEMFSSSGPSPGLSSLQSSLLDFVNMVLAGGVPLEVRPTFFGAHLHAFTKSSGGIRPIAVGCSLRRLVAKIANRIALDFALPCILPRQLGVGTPGGTDAIIHSARAFLAPAGPASVLVKLDFRNAFNSIRRDSVLDAVSSMVPGLLPFALSAYGSPSDLLHGPHTISSSEGVQQGDPLGPLLFSLAIARPLNNISCPFVAGYLDDITLGGSVPELGEAIESFASEARALGLTLNISKCEIIGLEVASRPAWEDLSLPFSEPPREEAALLGVPIFQEGLPGTLDHFLSSLGIAADRLRLVSSHEAFFLLRNCLSLPKLQHILRSSRAFECPVLAAVDVMQAGVASAILNVELSGSALTQSGLPVRWGGVGLRSFVSLAPSAFLASTNLVRPLIHLLLRPSHSAYFESAAESALSFWSASGAAVPLPSCVGSLSSQRLWDDRICDLIHTDLLVHSSGAERARLLAAKALHSGAWLHALPSANIGLRLSDRDVGIAIGLRLGCPVVVPHVCRCGVLADALGHHSLSCRLSAGRSSRHHEMNGIISRSLVSAGFPTLLEPPGLMRGDGKRPDGTTLVPWSHGRPLLWDFTCPDTLAASHLPHTSVLAGAAARRAESAKSHKYSALLGSYNFFPVAIETLGSYGDDAAFFLDDLGTRLTAKTGDVRSSAFLHQRLGVALQRGNALCVMGTLPRPTALSESSWDGDGRP